MEYKKTYYEIKEMILNDYEDYLKKKELNDDFEGLSKYITDIINIIHEKQKTHILGLLDLRDIISITYEYEFNYIDNEDKLNYIRELEKQYNCDIDVFYNIKFKEVK